MLERVLVIFCVVGLFLGVSANASVIPLSTSGWSITIRPNLEGQVSVYNDQTGTVGNDTFVSIELSKYFVGDVDSFGGLQPIYVEFIKTDASASNLIVVRDEFVTNDTTANWSGFKMMLGNALSTPMSGFDPMHTMSGDQFSSVVYEDYNGYDPGTGQLPTTIHFSNGIVPHDPPDVDDFQPGWASGDLVIVANPAMAVGDRIVFKELPLVPEPVSLALFGIAGLALLKRRNA